MLNVSPWIFSCGAVSISRYASTMSSTCRLGRIWLPPNTVIAPLLTAWLVRMLTERSRRGRGGCPQVVAGRVAMEVEVSAFGLHRNAFHEYFEPVVSGTSGWSSVTSGESLTP